MKETEPSRPKRRETKHIALQFILFKNQKWTQFSTDASEFVYEYILQMTIYELYVSILVILSPTLSLIPHFALNFRSLAIQIGLLFMSLSAFLF